MRDASSAPYATRPPGLSSTGPTHSNKPVVSVAQHPDLAHRLVPRMYVCMCTVHTMRCRCTAGVRHRRYQLAPPVAPHRVSLGCAARKKPHERHTGLSRSGHTSLQRTSCSLGRQGYSTVLENVGSVGLTTLGVLAFGRPFFDGTPYTGKPRNAFRTERPKSRLPPPLDPALHIVVSLFQQDTRYRFHLIPSMATVGCPPLSPDQQTVPSTARK